MNFNPLDHSVCLEMPAWLEETAWAGHLPFAMLLVSAARPRLFVELGVDRGTSYCAFCQAVARVGADTTCIGIDTWEGDEHAGFRSSEVLDKLRDHHDPRYAGFSKLVRSTFDEALPDITDGAVDILHIDGFHTYDVVRHDFETWLPKMSDRGIVLFHDTTVHERNFGVWKFWAEVSAGRPHFEFRHSSGLGVLSVGTTIPERMQFLFDADQSGQDLIRLFFEAIGGRCDEIVHSRRQLAHMHALESKAGLVSNSRVLTHYHDARRALGRIHRRIRGGE